MKISVIVPVYNVEKYIRETLVSIQEQTFTDYEVIIVNDSSPDNSQAIIDEFCKQDNRFKSYIKANEGVSAARNFGLNVAQGEYILFVDGDDLLPPKSLEMLYRRAKEEQADMAIGIMQEFGIYGSAIYVKTRELAQKKYINRYDPLMVWTFSVCNKLLKKTVIDQYHLRFEKIRHAEDGLFLFQFLHRCQRITGCNAVVYRYRKRPFWAGKSATQSATEENLRSLLYALDNIAALIKRQQGIELERVIATHDTALLYEEQTRCEFDIYRSKLYYRFIQTSLLNEYYRQIWKNDDGVLELVRQSLETYKRHLFPDMWKEIINNNKDLRLEQGILNKEELVKSPLLTVAISDQVPGEHMNRIIASLYNQQIPALVIGIHGGQRPHVDEVYQHKNNIFWYDENLSTGTFKNKILQEAESPYISFIDEPVYLNLNTYRVLYNFLENNDTVDFCSCKLKLIQGEQTVLCQPHDILYFDRYKRPNIKTKYYQLDWMMGNKLFRVSSLHAKQFLFKDDPAHDARKCFRLLTFRLVGNAYVFTPLTQHDVVDKAKSLGIRWFWKWRYRREQLKTAEGKRLLKKRIGKGKQVIAWFVKRHIIAFTPIRKKVLFVSVRGSRLQENAKAVYDAYDGKKVVFSQMYPHSKLDRLRLYWHLFSSKVIVTDDYLRYLRLFKLKDKQKIIQIWHACGAFKKFGLDYPSADIKTERQTHYQYDTVVVSAEGVREIYAGAFGIDTDHVRALGVPRTDKLLDKAYIEREKEAFYSQHPQLIGKKVLLYAPTFRENRGKRVRLDPKLNWDEVSSALGDDMVLIVKNHPVMKYDLLKGEQYPNILNMPTENTSRLMIVCDVMITDYSSVIFEAALLNKQTVFYCPDYQNYERDFYLKFPEDLYGELTTNQAELLKAIRVVLDAPQMDRLEQFKKAYMGSCDGHSTERVVALIKEKLHER